MHIDTASVEALELVKPLTSGPSSTKGNSLYRQDALLTCYAICNGIAITEAHASRYNPDKSCCLWRRDGLVNVLYFADELYTKAAQCMAIKLPSIVYSHCMMHHVVPVGI